VGKYHLQFAQKVDPVASLVRPVDKIIEEVGPENLPLVRCDSSIQALVRMLSDVSRMHQLLRQLGCTDVTSLHTLDRAILERAYGVLKQIAAQVPQLDAARAHVQTLYATKHQLEDNTDNNMQDVEDNASIHTRLKEEEANTTAIAQATSKKKAVEYELEQLSNAFFQLVPLAHMAGHGAIRAITTLVDVGKHVEQLRQFVDLHVTKKLLLGCQLRAHEMHPLDYLYLGLGVSLTLLASDHVEYERISQYVYAGQSRSAIEIQAVWQLRRHGEDERFAAFRHLPNRTLLWHGSNMVNLNGILSQGLRIAPPEAAASGYMFGKGVYFSDSFLKSIDYCRDNNDRHTPEGTSKCLLLAEVALGTSLQVHTAQYMEHAQPGTHSTHSIGMNGPDPRGTVVLPDGLVWPLGRITPVAVPTGWKPTGPPPPASQAYHCTRSNEFVVYNTDQVALRYLVQVGPPSARYLKSLKK
jgi:hypothetical protein